MMIRSVVVCMSLAPLRKAIGYMTVLVEKNVTDFADRAIRRIIDILLVVFGDADRITRNYCGQLSALRCRWHRLGGFGRWRDRLSGFR
jgi:hypothetical protein